MTQKLRVVIFMDIECSFYFNITMYYTNVPVNPSLSSFDKINKIYIYLIGLHYMIVQVHV